MERKIRNKIAQYAAPLITAVVTSSAITVMVLMIIVPKAESVICSSSTLMIVKFLNWMEEHVTIFFIFFGILLVLAWLPYWLSTVKDKQEYSPEEKKALNIRVVISALVIALIARITFYFVPVNIIIPTHWMDFAATLGFGEFTRGSICIIFFGSVFSFSIWMTLLILIGAVIVESDYRPKITIWLLIVLFIFTAHFSFNKSLMNNMDFLKTMAEATGVEGEKIESKTMLLLDGTKTGKSKIVELQVKASSPVSLHRKSDSRLAISEDQLLKIEESLRAKKYSWYKESGGYDIAKGWFLNWDIEKGEAALRRLAASGDMLGQAIWLLRLRKTAQLSDANFGIVRNWIDTGYFFGSKIKYSVYQAARRFGEKEIMNKFEGELQSKNRDEIPKLPKIINGEISGRIKLKNLPRDCKVGLFYIEPCKSRRRDAGITDLFNQHASACNLVKAYNSREGNEFKFDNLIAGKYLLALAWNGDISESIANIKITGGGIMELSDKNPRRKFDVVITLPKTEIINNKSSAAPAEN
ncbi:MAG: hypothetical protein FP827_04805 [Candidatus Omnitrophica bacterium]|nr:hypothetical protein [Candidatus Omnitrophota bacterium]